MKRAAPYMLCLLSGGNWNNGSNAGVWYANLNNYRHNSNNNVGCRADCESHLIFREETLVGKSGTQGCVVLRYANSIDKFFLVALFCCLDEGRTSGFIAVKRIGYLFEQAFSRDNLYQAYLNARKGKRNKRACFRFELYLGTNLEKIYQEIWSGNYQPKPYFKFTIYEPKERTIYAPAFRDVVVQHAIYRIIYPIFDKTFISTSFACRVGYGTHKASAATQQMLRQCKPDDYTLKLDLRKFFYRIDRGILEQQIRRKLKDDRLIHIMMQFAEYPEPIGIPIGNLLSQIYALIYLNPLDQYIKRALQIKNYVRYVDDFILIGLTRDQCIDYRQQLIEWLDKNLSMTLSKSSIQKVKQGLNFVGYRTWQGKKFIRKHSLYRFKASLKKGKLESCVSILGHAKQTASLNHLLNYVRETSHDIYRSLPQAYHRLHHYRNAPA